jgi:hypothetical protein
MSSPQPIPNQVPTWLDSILDALRHEIKSDLTLQMEAIIDQTQISFEAQAEAYMTKIMERMMLEHKKTRDSAMDLKLQIRKEWKAVQQMQLNMYKDMDDFVYFHNQALEVRRNQIVEEMQFCHHQFQEQIKSREDVVHKMFKEMKTLALEVKSLHHHLMGKAIQHHRKKGGLV